MSKLDFPAFEYRHVVFPDANAWDRGPVNFSPKETTPPTANDCVLNNNELECVRWLLARVGLSLTDYRLETLKRRLPACMRALRVESMWELRSLVELQPHLLQSAVSALIIGVSSFFRDTSVFSCLRDEILPRILSEEPAPRIWSAGCSDGAELYSMAILLAERGALESARLLGTDCRSDAISCARMGRYTPEGINGVPIEIRERYFAFDGRNWQAYSSLRAVPQWRCANILKETEPGGWDLILCRNMAIYIHPTAAGWLWGLLQMCLRPGGFLVLGKAERPHGATELKPVAPCIFQRDRS